MNSKTANMQFSSILACAALAGLAIADSVTFTNLDSIAKTIYFTGNAGDYGAAPTLAVPAKATVTWSAGQGFVGNFYSVNEGAANVPGMLGEINFAEANIVWYDVSAIVNPNDNAGVKKLWASAGDPISGCDSYPGCTNCYNLPNDIQTKSTSSRELYATVGVAGASKRDEVVESVRRHARDFAAAVRNAI